MPRIPDDILAAAARAKPPRPAAAGALPALVGSLALNGLALAAAFAGITWGAAFTHPLPTAIAWQYVQLSLAATWLLLWPLLPPARANQPWRRALLTQGLALAIGALPFFLVAAYITAPPPSFAPLLAAQAALACAAAGLLSWRTAAGTRAHLLTALLPLLYLFAPLLAYLQNEFAPFWPTGWQTFVPALWLYRVAIAGPWIPGPLAFYAALGLLLLALHGPPPRPRPS